MAELTPCWVASCERPAQPEHSPCCSSTMHGGRPLCCEHYGRAHFCEGACDPSRHPIAPVATACPECAQGKHGNCDGQAWDFTLDEMTPCQCKSAEHEVAT